VKEYLICFRYGSLFTEWKWGRITNHCKMTGENLPNVEDEIRDHLKVDFVQIMTFQELKSAND
jgi:predicted SpoU family rRNA methylase